MGYFDSIPSRLNGGKIRYSWFDAIRDAGISSFAEAIISTSLHVGAGVVANAKSVLELTSTTKGVLLPRMTTTQRDAITSPPEGLEVFNITTHAKEYFNGTTWVSLTASSGSSALPDPQEIGNAALSATAATNVLTVALKTLGGTNPTVSDPVKVGVRHPTIATGQFNQRSVTSALSMAIASGTTFGLTLTTPGFVYVYLVDSDGAGAMKLGFSRLRLDESLLYTTVNGTSGSNTSNNTLYSDGVYASKPIALIGSMVATVTGTGWSAAPTNLFIGKPPGDPIIASVSRAAGQVITSGSFQKVTFNSERIDSHNAWDATTNFRFTAPESRYYLFSGTLSFSATSNAGEFEAALLVEGARISAASVSKTGSSGLSTGVTYSLLAYLSAGQYAEIWAYQNTGGNLDLRGDASNTGLTHLNVQKIT